MSHEEAMREAVALARQGVADGSGGPFGAVVVRDGRMLGRGCNQVTSTHDPTAHAEMVAIRDACRTLGHFQLAGCSLYTSCEPCPMCLGAIYWARLDRVFYAATHRQAAAHGFDDAFIYAQVALPPADRRISFVQLRPAWGELPFEDWARRTDRTDY